jgi:eukaryotic-like serine/threonine-protein kinase
MADAAAERRRQIMDAFDAALDQPEGTRTAWLEQHFDGDAELVQAVRSLIAADSQPTMFPHTVDSTADLVPPERVGVYRLVEPIGGGGMGEVWLGERDDGLFDHRVAIKLMRPSLFSPELEDFFDRERRLLARMRHPNIARLFDGGVSVEGVPWFAMDLVEGVPLDEWADRAPSLGSARKDVAERVRVAALVCDAVHHAHRNLIVHADLKPPNILVDKASEPRLVDFGIADLVAAADDPALKRRYPNTPGYASPERLAGSLPSIPDDIFALGTVLHGLLSGAWIEKGERSLPPPSAEAKDPERVRVLRGDLDAIVTRARAADPTDRYASADAMAADLRAWLDRRPVAARNGGWRYHIDRFVRRHQWLTASIAAALVALIATTIAISTLYFRAERALTAAEQRFNEVRGLARYMLVDLYDALEPLAGAADLRARTADFAREYLERLTGLAAGDLELQRELGVGYGRVGRAYGLTATNGSVGFEQGERALMRADELLAPLVDAHPERQDLKVELARILAWRSSITAFARSDPAEAHRLLDRAIALADAALAAEPGLVDAGYARWQAVLGRLDVLSSENRGRELVALAEDQIRRAAALPTPAAYAQMRPLMEAAVHNAWGDGLYYSDRARDALVQYRRAYEILEAARRRATADVRVRTRMILYAYGISSTHQELGERAPALDWARRAAEDARLLQQFENSPSVAQAAAIAGLQYATMLVETGRPDDAIAEARAAVERRRQTRDADPGSDEAQAGYLFALKPYMQVLELAGRRAEACAVAREADRGWSELYRDRPKPTGQARDAELMAAAARRCAAGGGTSAP